MIWYSVIINNYLIKMRGDYTMKIKFSSNSNVVSCLKSVVSFLEVNASETPYVRHPGVTLEFSLFNWDPFLDSEHMVTAVFPLNDFVLDCSGPIPNFATMQNIENAITGCKDAMLCYINSIMRKKEIIRNEIDFINNKRAVAVEKRFHSVRHWDERLEDAKERENRIKSKIVDCRFYQQCIEKNQLSFKIGFENGGYNEKYDYIKVLPLLDVRKTVYPVYYTTYGFSSVEPFQWYKFAIERAEEINT